VSIHVALNHVTRYRYDRLVALGPQIVRLRPAPHCRTRILAYSLKVLPEKHFINWQQDPESNYLARLVFPDKTEELRIEVDLVAEMAVLNPFDFFLEPYAETYPFGYQGAEKRDLAPYLVMFRGEPLFKEYLSSIPRERKRTIDWLVELNLKLSRDIKYLIRMEPGVQTPELTLRKRSGSCRDSTWLLVQLLRHMGLAARFVSGYLIQLTADMKSLDGPSGPEQDFTDLHAWCEVYLPGAGWIGLDPTSGLLAGEGHIPLACTPEPGAAAPITGAVEKAEVQFEHHMKVERVWKRHASPSRIPSSSGRRSSSSDTPSTRSCWPATCASRWEASRPSYRWTTRMAPSGTPPPWGSTSGASPSRSTTGSSRSTRPRACRTSARASGIRVSSCRAGRSTASGAATANRSGRTRSCWTTKRAIAASRRRLPRPFSPALPDVSASRPSTSSRPSKTPSITCGASGSCHRTSTRSSRSSRIRWNARGSPRSSSAVSTPSSATCCRWRATRPEAGARGPGSCDASVVT
jgi:transglutaminase-like putative cysteine protease